MPRKPQFLTASQAARRLGVSPKALRLYEDHGLMTPGRTRAGWRAFGPADMETASEIVSLRKLGLGFAEITSLLKADPSSRDDALTRHRSSLESRMQELGIALRNLAAYGNRQRQAAPPAHEAGERARRIAFDLLWPWGGECFEFTPSGRLTYITGPLGSGKTRLAIRLAEVLPDGRFLGPDRVDGDGRPYAARLRDDAALRSRCDPILHWLERNGATSSAALNALVAALCSDEPAPLVIDMVEQGLDRPTQLALANYLRHRDHPARPLFLMTRSSAILDLSLAESGETIIYCPANHSPPLIVHPDPSCPGYEAVATCLATPEVRARTAGVIAAWAVQATPAVNDSRETMS